ncbi:xylulokinase [Acetobacteraceae bacterium ESL0709]|nr:xylulokinase [Acetobacteraceae bacterium ESL0697]MDF7678045.1 xylulokinase [Acetobacteraceae bacterium ESL0709]
MFLGIDLGTSSVKAVLVDSSQNIVAVASHPFTVQRPYEGWSEQEPSQWLEGTVKAVRRLMELAPAALSDVEAVGLSGQQHGAVFLDEKGRVLRPCMLWNDTRSEVECGLFEARFPGCRSVLGSMVMPSFTAPKVLWVARHEPEIFARTKHILLPKAWLRYALTGLMCEEMSDASGTAWLDIGKRNWSSEALEATGLKKKQMPELCEGSDRAGTLKAEYVALWGMKKAPIFAGGAGDNAAGAMGLGAINDGDAFVSLGTSGVLWMTSSQYHPYPEAAIHTFCHALPEKWHHMGVMLSAAASFKWWSGVSGAPETTLLAELPAEIRTPSSVLFAPYLSGERTPYNDGRVKGAFIGLSHNVTRADLTQAVLEGVAFSFRDALEAIRKTGDVPHAADVIGGGSRSLLWTQIMASVMNLPLYQIQNGDQGGAFGATRLARIALTGEDSKTVCKPPERINLISPHEELVQSYDDAYRRYRKLYPALSGFRSDD